MYLAHTPRNAFPSWHLTLILVRGLRQLANAIEIHHEVHEAKVPDRSVIGQHGADFEQSLNKGNG